MKIIVVAKDDVVDETGGARVAFYNMTNLFSRSGHQVYGVFYNDKNGFKSEKISENFTLTNLYKKESPFEKEFSNFVKEISPDLIIFHFSTQIVDTKFDISENASIPTILMFHSRPDVFLKDLKKIKLENINIVCSVVLLKSFVNLAKSYINAPCVVIGNEISQQKEITNLSVVKKNIIFYSRIDNNKGIDFLIDSLAMVADKIPGWKINLYGSVYCERQKDGFLEYIKKNKLKKQINICGCVNKEESKKAFLNSDFCVYPSYLEGFGIGLAETMSYGLPCIGLKRATGVNELIKDGYNGYLVEKDEKIFAEKILELVNNKEKRIELGKNAVESVKQYAPEIISEKWLNLLRGIENKEDISNFEIKDLDNGYQFFSMAELLYIGGQCDTKTSQIYHHFVERIFSLVNIGDMKIVTILGFKFKFKLRIDE